MRVLDLFSGIGGFSLGLERAGMDTVAFCEIEPFCQKVLKKHWPQVPIHEDVRTLDGKQYKGAIDVICGGYPCQPFSVAGKRAGDEDDRHLWPEVLRLLQETKSPWFIGENVAGHISMGLDQVLSDLENSGYTAQTFVIPAVAVDAQHRRDRIWIVANSNSSKLRQQSGRGRRKNRQNTSQSELNGETQSMANPTCGRCLEKSENPSRAIARDGKERQTAGSDAGGETLANPKIFNDRKCKPSEVERQAQEFRESDFRNWRQWPVEPSVGRVANGVPRRMDRLRSLGNSVVPQIPEIIGRAIIEYESGRG